MSRGKQRSVFDVPMMTITALYMLVFGLSFAGYLVLKLFWGDMMLIDLNDLGSPPGTSVWTGLSDVWFIFLWAIVTTIVLASIRTQELPRHEPQEVLVKGWWISLNAGVFEEFIYRFFVFASAMVLLPFFNFITFGFIKWFYASALIPVANWSTLGALEPQLLGHPNWVFGAAVVFASVSFRDAHKYLGFVGYVNAWFLGMIMFWLMFNYGIFAAIMAHVLYDAVIFAVLALVMKRNSPAYSSLTIRR